MCKKCNQLTQELAAVKKDALVWAKRATYHANHVVKLQREVTKLSTEALERDREERRLGESNLKESKKGIKEEEIRDLQALLEDSKAFWKAIGHKKGGAQ